MNDAALEVQEPWISAFAWIERELGGRIVRAERQPRWRPAWFLDLERDGELLPLYFRGDRGATDHGIYTLEDEMHALQVLAAQGMPVPQVYGFCPHPRGIVMERVHGHTNLATCPDPAERRAVLEHYMELLARMHALDTAPFIAAGLRPPADPQRIALGDFAHWERGYRKAKRRPEPLIEFVIGWVHRNVPRARTQVSFLAGDSGQFLFDKGRVTTMLDFEVAYLGDPAADLGGLRSRTLSEPLGDIAAALEHYARVRGEPIDTAAVDYHTVRFGICTPMSVAATVAAPPPGTDYVRYLAWYLVYARMPLEVIAHRQGIALDAIAELRSARSRYAAGHDALLARIDVPAGLDPAANYEADTTWRIAEYLRRADRFGPACEAADLDEAAVLLGFRPADCCAADEALEKLVADAGAERDAELVRFFHRRLQRQESILRPVMREFEDARVQLLD
ncbi:MAG TPA: phosphotransferase [Pseudomonadales bacterium]|nr:phosphotransferase [Pseudomonadales bacterium]